MLYKNVRDQSGHFYTAMVNNKIALLRKRTLLTQQFEKAIHVHRRHTRL